MDNIQIAEASSVERSATIKVKDVPAAERQWIAAVLHVDLADEDEFTMSLRRPAVHIPDPQDREAARDGLRAVLSRLHERMKDEPEGPITTAIDEAILDTQSHKN
jgi:hypothetical protein